MNPKSLKILAIAAVWSASSGAAFYFGRQTAEPANKVVTAMNPSRALNDRAPMVVLGGSGALADGRTPPSLQDLLHTKGKPDADLLKLWADSLDPTQCAALLTELEKLEGGQPRDALIEAMIGSWAERDPQNYLTGYGKISNARVRESGVAGALRALAEKDPKAAITWLSESADAVPNQMLAQRYRSAIEGLATKDPAGAFDFINGLGNTTFTDQQIKRQGFNTLADELATQGKFSDAAQLFSAMPDEALRNSSTARLMARWAEASPAEASAYIAGITDPAERNRLGGQMVQSWARNDPQAAATFAATFDQSISQATGETSGQALANAVRSWSRYDLNGPAEFLNKIPPSPATDPAVLTFAMRARTVDATTAMNWAGVITDPALRERVSGSVALRMLANGDTEGLKQVMSGSSLTTEQKQWLSTLPTDNPQALQRMSRRMGANWATNQARGAPWSQQPAGQPGQAPQNQRGGRGG